MEPASEQLPLKVCRHCSVASRTESETCPSCGRSYSRGVLRWRWWYAIPIVAIAFAGGYFGLSQLVYDDDEPATVTEEEAGAIEPGASRTEVEDELGAPEDEFANEPKGGEGAALTCTYYELAGDSSERVWQFCFQGDVLATSVAVDLPAD